MYTYVSMYIHKGQTCLHKCRYICVCAHTHTCFDPGKVVLFFFFIAMGSVWRHQIPVQDSSVFLKDARRVCLPWAFLILVMQTALLHDMSSSLNPQIISVIHVQVVRMLTFCWLWIQCCKYFFHCLLTYLQYFCGYFWMFVFKYK